jgi:glycosyltransferase involved in cell wall biosynthesis
VKVYLSRNKTQALLERVIDRVTRMLGAQYLFFPFSSRRILELVRELKPDVISLHNTHGGYFETSLLEKISVYAPVVWTLHDMWSFTGNSAHTFGDESWKEMRNTSALTKIYPAIGFNTGQWLLKRKKKIYQRSRLTIVCPSKWLFNLAEQSPVFQGKRVQHINNGVDLNVFRPHDKTTARARLGVPDADRVIMFSAEHLNDSQWKGGNDLLEMLSAIDNMISFRSVLLVVGSGRLQGDQVFKNLRVHYTGFVHAEETLVDCYCSSDLFLYPTKADNLPNVLVEAIACGIPCATFDIGGCKEIIVDGYNGLVLEKGNNVPLLRLLTDRHTLSKMSVNARQYAEEHFSIEKMGEQYYNLFESLG